MVDTEYEFRNVCTSMLDIKYSKLPINLKDEVLIVRKADMRIVESILVEEE
jgi:hypothetical protein